MDTPLYDRHTRHSDSYYLAVIEGLLAGVAADLTDQDIASSLNERSLRSSTGAAWTKVAVTQSMWKLRHQDKRGGYLHNAMLQLCFDGLLTKAQVLPLLQHRNQPAMCM